VIIDSTSSSINYMRRIRSKNYTELEVITRNFYYETKTKNMCAYGHPTDPIFQLPTLPFFIGNYSTLIFASDPINFYTEFG
jgi:hypothetical protein